MGTSIMPMGCPQPGRLAPERAPAVEAGGDVGVEDVLRPAMSGVEDRSERVVAGASGAEPVAVRLEASLPLGFERQPRKRLSRAVVHRGDAEWARFRLAGLGDPNSADGASARLRRQGSR